jgi:hypothetical protein
MATVAKIFMDDISALSEGYYLHECNYRVDQSFDYAGKPAGRPVGGQINIAFDSLMNNAELFEWAVNERDYRSGRIEFLNEVVEIDHEAGMTESKTLEFIDAACVSFIEKFATDKSTKTYISLVAKSIKLNTIEYKNPWPENA